MKDGNDTEVAGSDEACACEVDATGKTGAVLTGAPPAK
jgi:hypothetical protein